MLLSVLVSPKASRNAVEDIPAQPNTVRVRTTAAAADNKANFAVIDLLAEYYDVPKSSIRIVRGHASRKKLVEIPE